MKISCKSVGTRIKNNHENILEALARLSNLSYEYTHPLHTYKFENFFNDTVGKFQIYHLNQKFAYSFSEIIQLTKVIWKSLFMIYKKILKKNLILI